MLIAEPPLQVLPSLAVAIGLNEALFLQQLHFWLLRSSHEHEGSRWIYNSYEEWHAQLPFWSIPTIRRVVKRLEQPIAPVSRPVIRSTQQLNRHPLNHTKWYTIDYEAVAEFGSSRSDHNDHIVCSPTPARSAQIDHISLQRLPETTDRDTHPAPTRDEEAKPTGEAAETAAATPAPLSPTDAACAQPARCLVQQFYALFHGSAEVQPRPKEVQQAENLLRQHGAAKAASVLPYARQMVTASQGDYYPHTFGGILPFVPSAIAAYDADQRRQAQQYEAVRQEREEQRREHYERYRREQVAQYKATMAPDALAELTATVRTQVAGKTPALAMGFAVQVGLDTALAQQQGVLSFEAWYQQQGGP